MSDFTGVIESAMSGGDTSSEPTDAASPAATPVEPSETSVSDADPAASAPEAAPTGSPATAADPLEGQAVPYARFKAVNEERNRYEQQFAWAKDITPDAAPHIAEFYRSFRQDPIGTLIREVEGLASGDPSSAQAVRSAAARWLGANRGQAPVRDTMPEPDLQTADGDLVYSHAQQMKLMQWQDRRADARFAEKLQPLQQYAQQAQAEQLRAKISTDANAWAQKTFAEWSKRPHFLEHKQAIGELMRDRNLGLADAYVEILTTKVLPSLQASERSSVVAAMHQKVAAGTANPARTPAQGLKRPATFSEAIRQQLGT